MKYSITDPMLHLGAWDGSAGIVCGPEHFVVMETLVHAVEALDLAGME